MTHRRTPRTPSAGIIATAPGAAIPPIISILDRAECDAILARNSVGRIAFAFHDRVDIEPIHYVYEDGWVYARTSPGSKLTALEHNPWVALEVDEIRGQFDWDSVVVHGAFYISTPEGNDAARHAWKRSLDAIRRLTPGVGTDADPVAFRTVLFRIQAVEVTGRAAKSPPT
jgi:nitroimidazol reductase NimA-like FMN-containing flavoprotein (pyridoxamine 5'-phosphate oxidase superfamily)